MSRIPQTEPRKKASQARSKDTVNALLRATAHILVREGYERLSTNKIAAVAGTSIGSVYQYFPTKEALVAAVIDRHQEDMMAKIRAAMITIADQPVQTAARELVRVMIDAHRLNPKLHRVLSEQVPRVGRLENAVAFEREGTALLASYLAAHQRELEVSDARFAAFICVTTVEALTHATVINRPDQLSDSDTERLVEHVTRLIEGYLCRPHGHATRRND